MKKILNAYTSLIVSTVKTFLGKSYYHVHKPIGTHLDPGKVKGYYIDYSEKAHWNGETDPDGIPLIVLSNNKRIYFPITIAQMALGHYELWLERNESYNKDYFLKLAAWLKDNQDESGGWENPWEYLRPSCISNYSAMAQGQALSVMIRAYMLIDDESLLDSSYRAFYHMTKAVEKGGCTYYTEKGMSLEEYPEVPRSSVLNGWIYATFGLYDLMLSGKDKEVKESFEHSVKTLALNLENYDMGYWSYYDLHSLIASPYYHKLHITLLDALYVITKNKVFKDFSEKWTKYENNTLSRTRALGMKALQRVRNPQLITIIK